MLNYAFRFDRRFMQSSAIPVSKQLGDIHRPKVGGYTQAKYRFSSGQDAVERATLS